MSQNRKTIFVGNIPYSKLPSLPTTCACANFLQAVPEEQIVQMLERAGHVVKFRLIMDKENGKPKGFGFAEFEDYDSAASAVRNLDETELGGRKLRVAWSNDGDKDGDGGAQPTAPTQTTNVNGQVPPSMPPSVLPPLPQGTDLPAGLECPDAISTTLRTLPPAQLLDLMRQVKTLAQTDPAQATALFAQMPQFSYAIFQALLLLGLVDTNILSQVIEQGQQAAPATAPPRPPVQQPPPAFTGYPQFNQPSQVATPPMVSQPFQQPAQIPQMAQMVPPQMSAEQIGLLLNLSQQQIDAMPKPQRDQILAIRAQLLAQQQPRPY
jgi:cleavage stimulation factor subunit 2